MAMERVITLKREGVIVKYNPLFSFINSSQRGRMIFNWKIFKSVSRAERKDAGRMMEEGRKERRKGLKERSADHSARYTSTEVR